MIKAILVDDEVRLLSSLQLMLERNCPQVSVAAVCRSADEAFKAINAMDPDLVFLDIAMPGKDAFELLNDLGEVQFQIIFVTAHNQYSLRAFKFSALDYLLKPVDEEELVAAVNKAESAIVKERDLKKGLQALIHNLKSQNDLSQQTKLCLATLAGFTVVSLSDIIYCEADGAYTYFYLLEDKKICVSRPLSDYELLLGEAGFLRIHKSFLVNLNHTREYRRGEGGTVILSNGAELFVSRRKKELFLEKVKGLFKY